MSLAILYGGMLRLRHAVLLALLVAPLAARADCPDGTFELDDSPLASVRDADAEMLTLEGGFVTLEGGCAPVPVVMGKTTRRGTKLTARLEFCDGLKCPVTMKAVLSPDCQTIEGLFQAKKRKCRVKLPFGGSRWTCGDGVLDADELCDGAALGGDTCTTLGYSGGVLLCAPDCTFDFTLCDGALARCGNSVREADEQCDVNDFGTDACDTLGYPSGGMLACTPDCKVVTDGCYRCGDGVRGGTEQCDGRDDGLCPAAGTCGTGSVLGAKVAACTCPQACCMLPGNLHVCDDVLAAAGGVDYCTLLGGVMKAFAGVPDPGPPTVRVGR